MLFLYFGGHPIISREKFIEQDKYEFLCLLFICYWYDGDIRPIIHRSTEGRCFEFQISTTNEIKQEMNVNAMLCKQRYLFGKIYSASILLYNLLNRVADMILWISLSCGKTGNIWNYFVAPIRSSCS